MARFRGTVKGNRSEASRLGHAPDGLVAEAQTWSGKVRAYAYDEDGEDRVRVQLKRHKGNGRTTATLYDGAPDPSDEDLALELLAQAKAVLNNSARVQATQDRAREMIEDARTEIEDTVAEQERERLRDKAERAGKTEDQGRLR